MIIPQPPNNDLSVPFSLGWLSFFSNLSRYFAVTPRADQALPNFVNDAAAAAGGVPQFGYYRNGSIVMQRIV